MTYFWTFSFRDVGWAFPRHRMSTFQLKFFHNVTSTALLVTELFASMHFCASLVQPRAGLHTFGLEKKYVTFTGEIILNITSKKDYAYFQMIWIKIKMAGQGA